MGKLYSWDCKSTAANKAIKFWKFLAFTKKLFFMFNVRQIYNLWHLEIYLGLSGHFSNIQYELQPLTFNLRLNWTGFKMITSHQICFSDFIVCRQQWHNNHFEYMYIKWSEKQCSNIMAENHIMDEKKYIYTILLLVSITVLSYLVHR